MKLIGCAQAGLVFTWILALQAPPAEALETGTPANIHRLARLEAVTDLTTKNARYEESNLADVIVDALRAAENTDIAFMAASYFEDVTIKKGPTSTEEALKAVTFHDHNVLVVKLNGDQVAKAFEHALGLYPQRSSYFLQVSGVMVTSDAKAPKDQRVEAIRVNGRPLEKTKIYTVAMPAPLADGALAYYTVWPKTAIDKSRTNTKTVAEAVTSYLAGKKSIGEPSDPRLVFKK